MKVTSYEISKKLKEIGFKAETEINWVEYQKYDRDKEIITWHEDERVETWESVNSLCRAYDLETLISVLPDKIFYDDPEYDGDEFGGRRPRNYSLMMNMRVITYIRYEAYQPSVGYGIDIRYEAYQASVGYGIDSFHAFYESIKEGESLTDICAKIMIKLHEKGLIKFDK